MSRRLLLALVFAAGCKSGFDNGFGVGLRLLADGSIAVQTHDFVVDVSGSEQYQTDVDASAKFVTGGEERVLYRPGVRSGQLDFHVEAHASDGALVATGQALGVKLKSGQTVTADVHLTSNAPGDLAGADLTGIDLAGVDLAGVDLTAVSSGDLSGVDQAGVEMGPVCTSANDSCSNANTLHACKSDGSGFVDSSCALGCSSAPAPHCQLIVPSANGPTQADLDPDGLLDITITTNTTLNGDTGEIIGVRNPNGSPDVREISASGIAFHRVAVPGGGGGKIGIFSFKSLTVANNQTLTLTGPNAVALVASANVTVLGSIDARGTCLNAAGGPGGGAGGTVASGNGGGKGGGNAGVINMSDDTSGGGGGGFGDDGGSSPEAGAPHPTYGGAAYPSPIATANPLLVPIVGGSGGGRGGDGSAVAAGGNGGGGGGALQIVAGGALVVGTGTTALGINAGGCGGSGASIPSNVGNFGDGGGGGSGGAVLLEGVTVRIDSSGVYANGGGGGGAASGLGGTGMSGSPGGLSLTGSTGGMSNNANCGNGGNGGSNLSSSQMMTGSVGGIGGGEGCAGGGGGGSGRIRVNSQSGAATVTVSGNLSPRFGDMSSHGELLATQGTVAIQ